MSIMFFKTYFDGRKRKRKNKIKKFCASDIFEYVNKYLYNIKCKNDETKC